MSKYNQVNLPTGTYYYYDYKDAFYLKNLSETSEETDADVDMKAQRIRLYATSEDRLESKILTLTSAAKALRIEAFRYAKSFADMYMLYKREYISPREKRNNVDAYEKLLTAHFPEDRLPAADDFIVFFEKNSDNRSKVQLSLMSEICNDICVFSAEYGIPYIYPEAQIKKFIEAHDNASADPHMYTEEEWKIIKEELLKKKNGSYKYGQSAFIILFLCDVCKGLEEILAASWEDFKVIDGKTHFIFHSNKKRADISIGDNDFIIPDYLMEILRELFQGGEETGSIFLSVPDKSSCRVHLRKILQRVALPDDISPLNFADSIRQIKNV